MESEDRPVRFSCDHCGRTYSVADELSGRAFRMKCKACGESILVRSEVPADALADEPLGPVAPLSVLHAAEAEAAASLEPAVPEENPFVAQPVTAARAAAAVDGSLGSSSHGPVLQHAPPAPRAVAPRPSGPFALDAARSGAELPPRTEEPRPATVEELRRSLAEELAADASPEIVEFEVSEERASGFAIGRLREPEAERPGRNGNGAGRNGNGNGSHAPRSGQGRNGSGRDGGTSPAAIHRLSDGEGAVALVAFTEPAVAAARPPRERAAVVAALDPAPAPARRSRAPLLVGVGAAMAVGLLVGWLVRGKGEPAPSTAGSTSAPQAVVAPAAPSTAEPPAPAPAVAVAPAPLPEAASPAEPAAGPRPDEAADRAALRRAARARRGEPSPPLAAPAEAEVAVPRSGIVRAERVQQNAQAPADPRPEPFAPAAVAEPDRAPVADAPRYMASGFKAPSLASKGCLSDNLRLPAHLADLVSGPVTVKFAVYPGGGVQQVQVVSPVSDPRIGEAVARAVRACTWVAGADADGKPAPMWVIQPVRFAE